MSFSFVLRQECTQKSKELREKKKLHKMAPLLLWQQAQWRWWDVSMDERQCCSRGPSTRAARPSLCVWSIPHGCFLLFLFNALLCIGDSLCNHSKDRADALIHVLPQVHCIFHVDEARVFTKLPVCVVRDPPLPVIGINHFPGGHERSCEMMSEELQVKWLTFCNP